MKDPGEADGRLLQLDALGRDRFCLWVWHRFYGHLSWPVRPACYIDVVDDANCACIFSLV